MCGIAGVVGGVSPVDEAALQKMIDSFHYRGPNDDGTWLHADIGLAHKRLSIIDTSTAGHQPMRDSDNGNCLVFNGEIYNYVEIRESLKKQGLSFNTGTDTEVILKAYQHYGKKCLEHFNGMFAFALWDQHSEELFIARDRLGIKPLYYYCDQVHGFVFASEVKAINCHLNQSWSVDLQLVDQYMSFGYVPGENALQKGVKRLLPGHSLTLKAGEYHVEQYWDLHFDNSEDKGFDYYLETARDLLNSAIDLRLRADVPLGIFLSGGIDSSAVVGLLADRVSEPLQTFSVGYDFGKEYNEADYAKLISKKFGTEHHEIVVDPKQFRDFIPKYIHLMDEPVTEAAAISLQYLSQLTAEQVTVVLSGEGSDELFAGYDYYKYMRAIERYRSLVGSGMASGIASLLSPLAKSHDKLSKYLNLSSKPLHTRYKGISSYDETIKSRLYRREYSQYLQQQSSNVSAEFLQHLFEKNADKDALSQMLYFDTKTWLVDDLLIKADRMSMASSLELRVPFLDYRLVEFAASMPSKYKIKNGESKYILKKMMEPILPKEIIYRKKMGFPTPLKLMFRQELAQYAKDLLLSDGAKIHTLFNAHVIEDVVSTHYNQTHDHHRLLWQLVVLEEWLGANQVSLDFGG